MKENFILVLYYRCQLSYFQSNNNLVLSLVNQNKHVQVALLGGRLATKGADILKQVRSFREMATKDLEQPLLTRGQVTKVFGRKP